MSYGDEFCTGPEQFCELVEEHFPMIIDGHNADNGPHLFREQLPRNNVPVMLQFGKDDLIPLTDVFPPITLRHEVHRLGSATQKDDFFRVRCPDELPHFFSSSLEEIGRTSGKSMSGPMNVRIVAAIELR